MTLPNLSQSHAQGAGEYLIITIKKETGILTPETPRGFDNLDEGYPVEITFLGGAGTGDDEPDSDDNIVVVKNPVSSTVPGKVVRMELEIHANVAIGSNEEIVIDFSGPSEDASFGLPTTIAKSRIKIRSSGKTFDPEDVLVQGDRVVLTVPDDEVVEEGDFTISFSQSARLKNPFTAGNRIITISSFVPDYVEDQITAVIRRTTTISPQEGPRGAEFTLQGKG